LNRSFVVAFVVTALIVGLISGYELGSSFTAHRLPSTQPPTGSLSTSTSTSPSTTTSTTSTSTRVVGATCGAGLHVGQAFYSPEQIHFLKNALDRNESAPIEELYQEYNSLFSPPPNFNTSVEILFNFRFPKNQYMNPEMYGGDYYSNNSYLNYPTLVEMGVEDGLLLIYIQVMNLYGSPYGNITSRGTNLLAVFMRVGNELYAFGEDSNMLPNGPLNHTWAVNPLNFSQPVVTREGYVVDAFQTFIPPNLTYYAGAPNSVYTSGTGLYSSDQTFNETGFFYPASVILGTYTHPLMTRYLYVINMSKLPFNNQSCKTAKIMFTLSVLAPLYIPNFTQYNLIDNYPGHNIEGPLNNSDYINITF